MKPRKVFSRLGCRLNKNTTQRIFGLVRTRDENVGGVRWQHFIAASKESNGASIIPGITPFQCPQH
jgi:hypothetical protein